MINPRLDIARLRQEFADKHMVVIDDFLVEPTARAWRDHYAGLAPHAWTATYFPKLGMELPNDPQHAEFHERVKQRVRAVADRGEYARFFLRIMGDRYTDPTVQQTQELFGSTGVRKFVEAITGTELTYANPAHVYNYSRGCFLTEHMDKGDGKVTFVYHLSENWQPEWGGLFEDLTDKTNVKTTAPAFNRLVLIDMAEHRRPHRVTPVAPDAPQDRLSVSAWFR